MKIASTDVTVVKRSEWYRGQGVDRSYLLRNDGTRCCVGFHCQRLGISDDYIRNVECVRRLGLKISPFRLPGSLQGPWTEDWIDSDKIRNFLSNYKSSEEFLAVASPREIVASLYGINDDPDIDDVTREQLLNKHANKLGFQFKFVD